MSQDYLKSWTFLSKEMQKPFQAMMELNIRALKDFRYFKIEELSQIRQPADLMGKQVSLAMENSHKMLNYMQESFHIMEHALLELSNELRDNSAKTMKLAGNDLFKNKMMMPADLMQEMMKASDKASPMTSISKKTLAKTKSSSSRTVQVKSTGSEKKGVLAKGKTTSSKKTVSAKPMAKTVSAKPKAKIVSAKPKAKTVSAKPKVKTMASKAKTNRTKTTMSKSPASKTTQHKPSSSSLRTPLSGHQKMHASTNKMSMSGQPQMGSSEKKMAIPERQMSRPDVRMGITETKPGSAMNMSSPKLNHTDNKIVLPEHHEGGLMNKGKNPFQK